MVTLGGYMKKSIITGIIGVSLLASSIPVFANNHADTEWGGTLPRLKTNLYTGPRSKTDSTSAYIKLNSCGKGGIKAWLQKADGTEIDSPKTPVKVGQSRKISNYAYEWYSKCDVRMAIESDYMNYVLVEAHGVWSPDSY